MKIPCVDFSLGTERTVRPLGSEEERILEALLIGLQKYYAYRGINLRTCCDDFDRHHIGVIQESQVGNSPYLCLN